MEVAEEEEVIEIERWWLPPFFEAELDGEGVSPKMKYFIKAPIKRTTVSCPRRKPCVNESLRRVQRAVQKSGELTYEVC